MSRIFKALERAEAGRRLRRGPGWTLFPTSTRRRLRHVLRRIRHSCAWSLSPRITN
jgi:hypothetical protein